MTICYHRQFRWHNYLIVWLDLTALDAFNHNIYIYGDKLISKSEKKLHVHFYLHQQYDINLNCLVFKTILKHISLYLRSIQQKRLSVASAFEIIIWYWISNPEPWVRCNPGYTQPIFQALLFPSPAILNNYHYKLFPYAHFC